MKRAPKRLIPYTGKRVMITLITLIIRQVGHRLQKKVRFRVCWFLQVVMITAAKNAALLTQATSFTYNYFEKPKRP